VHPRLFNGDDAFSIFFLFRPRKKQSSGARRTKQREITTGKNRLRIIRFPPRGTTVTRQNKTGRTTSVAAAVKTATN